MPKRIASETQHTHVSAMSGNGFGVLFRITTAGESHGAANVVVIEGCPPGLALHEDDFRTDMGRRRPGQSSLSSPRQESDRVEILSGVHEGHTLGTSIALMIRNQDARPQDYDALQNVYRPGHADATYEHKYGLRDARGGGRASARETVARVAAGVVAKKILAQNQIAVHAWVRQIGPHAMSLAACDVWAEQVDADAPDDTRCPDANLQQPMRDTILAAQKDGDSVGGAICVVARGLPAGLGEPVFDKLRAVLAHAFFSVPACVSVNFGHGEMAATLRGSAWNDAFLPATEKQPLRTTSNRHGGLLGGLSSGMPLIAHIGFHAPSSISLPQQGLHQDGTVHELSVPGRHDPCVVPRAVPIVEAMTAITLADQMLRHRANTIATGGTPRE